MSPYHIFQSSHQQSELPRLQDRIPLPRMCTVYWFLSNFENLLIV